MRRCRGYGFDLDRFSGLFMALVRMPAQYGHQDHETSHVADRHVPAVLDPLHGRLGFRAHVGQRHTRRRAEPQHRAAEADRVGEDTQEAWGNCSTGIIEAQSTRESRKIEPLMVSGISSQSCRRTGMVRMMAAQTATPMKGKCSASSVNLTFTVMFVPTAKTSIRPTMKMRPQSTWVCSWACLMIGE